MPPPLPAPCEAKPRVWSALVLGFLALGCVIAVSGVTSYLALVAAGEIDPKNPPTDEAAYYAAVIKMVSHLWGIALVVLPGQLTMLAAALGAACLSPVELRTRIGYVSGRVGWWALPLFLLGTIFMGAVGSLATTELFPETSASLQMFLAMARGTNAAEFVGAVILLSVVPGFVEETLFRGYIQRRLLQRWSPLAAIATSTAFFTIAHFDLQHMLGIVPLGFWLGYLAWRTGALWPGMLCHAAQNVLAMLSSRYGDPTEMGITPEIVPMLVVTGLAFVGAVAVLQFTRIPAQKT